MLPEPQRILIAAYSAGELSPRRRLAVEKLVRQSAEARDLLQALSDDSQRLRNLRRHTLPADFAESLFSSLPVTGSVITPSSHLRAGRSRMAPAIVAASALLIAGLGSVWIWSVSRNADAPNPQVVRDEHTIVKPDDPPVNPAPGIQTVEREPEPEPRQPPKRIIAKKPQPERKPTRKPGDELTAPSLPKAPAIQIAPPDVALPIELRDLLKPERRKAVSQLLGKSDVQRIDLFARDTHRALERLQTALRKRGLQVITDGAAADLAKRRVRAHYLIFTDDLTAAVWTDLLHSLADDDRKAEARKKPGEAIFDQVVFWPVTAADQRDLTNLIGADLAVPASKPKSASGIDIRKPLAEGTGDEVSKALGAKPGEAGPEKSALIVPVFPTRASPNNSRDIHRYLDGRRERQPGTVAVILNLRTTP